MRNLPLILLSLTAPLAAVPTAAANERDVRAETLRERGIPAQLDSGERATYQQVFAHIRAERWSDAQLLLDAMKPGPLHAVARAELFTAKGSPQVSREALVALLGEAVDLPQAAALARLAQVRGASPSELPTLPTAQRMVWFDGAPTRGRARSVRSDAASAELTRLVDPFLKADDGRGAEALLDQRAASLSPDALTEWRQRVAWIHYMGGNYADARRVAALAQTGSGEWRVHADWVAGLSAWRLGDYAGAQVAFQNVGRMAADVDLRAAGLYWASRADIAARRPDLVEARLQTASQYGDTFYGMLAREALGLADRRPASDAGASDEWRLLQRRPNVRVAAALVEIGEERLAADLLRHQARIGTAAEYPALTKLVGAFGLPSTQLWLAHNAPPGARPVVEARFPVPDWAPDGGWRVDRSLVFAHALQESRFDATVISPAGAYGLMQIMPAAATDIARARGTPVDRGSLSRPSTNIEIGQAYLEQLRDQPFTGGLLPKVIAAYNAGPTPVSLWNSTVRASHDPLLYIESIPYWETRGYVMTVMRNYWVYQGREGRASDSRSALAQGQWPRFPGAAGRATASTGGVGEAAAILRAD